MKIVSKWIKLLSRQEVDLVTISTLDFDFYEIFFEILKKRKEVFFTSFYKKNFTHYLCLIDNIPKAGKYLFKKYFDSEKKIKNLYREGKKLLQKTRKLTFSWKRKLNKNSSFELFLRAFIDFEADFKKVCYFYTAASWLAIEFWQEQFDKILNLLIKKEKLENEKERTILSAYQPWKKTAILRLQEEISQKRPAKEIIKKYQFLRSWAAVWYKPIDKIWIKNLKIPAKKSFLKLYSQKSLLKLLKPDLKEKEILELAPYLIFFKDWRDDLRREYVYLWSFLFDLIAKKFEIDRNDLGYLTADELKNCLKKGEINKAKIDFRKENLCIITAEIPKLKIKIVDEKIPERYKRIIESIEKVKVEESFRGLVAYPGKVRGRVRIIKTFHDLKKVEEGEILVAITTHPNFLPAMKKAVAFVTNEGGIVCHAAIVARELKKPCIVGTKIATEVLKDGDLVEVDAGKGIVKILKK
jgi:phosphoenolpyruvate synthase/pyruvate phosphate dikinase